MPFYKSKFSDIIKSVLAQFKMNRLLTRKPIRMLLINFLLVILLNGCFSEEHIKFLNIPVNGSIDQFANELVKLGYTELPPTMENQVKLSGMFIDKQCEIDLYGTSKSHAVYEVKVNVPTENRDSLNGAFSRIQKLCSSKYGIGRSEYKQYRNSDRFHFNEPRRIRQLNAGDFTRYTKASGIIILEVHSGSISITLTDKLNSEIQKHEMESGGV